jgi:hypothetical protein
MVGYYLKTVNSYWDKSVKLLLVEIKMDSFTIYSEIIPTSQPVKSCKESPNYLRVG